MDNLVNSKDMLKKIKNYDKKNIKNRTLIKKEVKIS